jgi:hypothetical protein
MLVRAAVCPHPPALVPEISQGAAALLDEVRLAAVAAVGWLADGRPDVVVSVGAGAKTRRHGSEVGGTLAGFGVDTRFGGPEVGLPLSLTVGAYLMECAGRHSYGTAQEIAATTDPRSCAEIGAGLGALAPHVGMLVMADLSARRTRRSPGPYDERAVGFDTSVTSAIEGVDVTTLLDLDAVLADELWAAGRPALQVLGGALQASTREWAARVTCAQAPLGVGYVVAQLEAR